MTPLRDELVRWCGFQYDPIVNRYFISSVRVNLRKFENPAGEMWRAFLLAADGVETDLCQIEGLGHLMQLVIAIDGDQNAIQLKLP